MYCISVMSDDEAGGDSLEAAYLSVDPSCYLRQRSVISTHKHGMVNLLEEGNLWTKFQSVEEMEKDANEMQRDLGRAVAFNLVKGWDPLPRQFIPDHKIDAVAMMQMEAEAKFHRMQHEQICSGVEELKKKWCVKSERSYNDWILTRSVSPLDERFSVVEYIKTGLIHHNFYPQPIVQELKFLMTAVVALKENAEGTFKKPREVRERVARTLLHPVDGNLLQLEFMIVGRKGTVYEDGVFVVTIELPEDYPEKDPKFVFETRIFHPYVDPVSMTVDLDRLIHCVANGRRKVPDMSGKYSPYCHNLATCINALCGSMECMTPQCFNEVMTDIMGADPANISESADKIRSAFLWWNDAYTTVFTMQESLAWSLQAKKFTQLFAYDCCGCDVCQQERIAERVLAFIMGTHPRLGAESGVRKCDDVNIFREMIGSFDVHRWDGTKFIPAARFSQASRRPVCTRSHRLGLPVSDDDTNASAFLPGKFVIKRFDASGRTL